MHYQCILIRPILVRSRTHEMTCRTLWKCVHLSLETSVLSAVVEKFVGKATARTDHFPPACPIGPPIVLVTAETLFLLFHHIIVKKLYIFYKKPKRKGRIYFCPSALQTVVTMLMAFV